MSPVRKATRSTYARKTIQYACAGAGSFGALSLQNEKYIPPATAATWATIQASRTAQWEGTARSGGWGLGRRSHLGLSGSSGGLGILCKMERATAGSN